MNYCDSVPARIIGRIRYDRSLAGDDLHDLPENIFNRASESLHRRRDPPDCRLVAKSKNQFLEANEKLM